MKKLHLLTLLVAVLIVFGAAAAQAAKVNVCHFPPGNPANWHTITVSTNALNAHLGHGDLEGTCLQNCEDICNDDDYCTQDVQADPDLCICLAAPRPAVDCDDSNDCTADSCDSGIGACLNNADILDGEACDDGDPGTTGEVCMGGVCSEATIVCGGGNESFRGAWPWQLSLQRFDGSAWQHVCGATLLTSNYALTAASCVFGESATDFRVVAGLHQRSDLTGTQTGAVSSFTVHSSYTGTDAGLTYDAAIVTLTGAISPNGGSIQFATLPPYPPDDFAGDTATLTGWGETALAAQIANDVLQQGAESVTTNAECDSRFGTAGFPGAIGAIHLCTYSGGLDPCTGDIGGPVVVLSGFDFYVVGIQSWPVDYVVPYASASSVPRVATRVSEILGWIGDQTP